MLLFVLFVDIPLSRTQSRGLVNQHIESFDHFLDVTLDRIRKANERIKCDADASWYLLYRVSAVLFLCAVLVIDVLCR